MIEIPNVELPEGRSGPWAVSRFIITPEGARMFNMQIAMRREGRRGVVPGEHTKLTKGGFVVMSDTPAEKSDHWPAVRHARGVILINGLGLGMVANACLLKPEVERAIIVENSPDVIALVAPTYRANAFTYEPPKGLRFGMVWHDIWPDICADNLEGMKFLHRRYGRRADWQGSWCREECQR